ncbi:MAG: vWA domain-containing protein [Candidatus Altiarchaeota archaeon]
MTNATLPTGADLGVSSSFGFGHPEYLLIAVPLLIILLLYVRRGGLTRGKFMFLAIRSTVVILIALSLASPVYFQSRKTIEDVPPITVLVDSSSSMRMYPNAEATGNILFDRLKVAIQNLTGKEPKVKLERFSEGNSTAIGDAIYHNMLQYSGEPSSVVLVSDGRNNRGRNPDDIAAVMAETNSSLYAVTPERKLDDVYIQSVLGDKKIPSNINYDLLVRVGNTATASASYDLLVYVDGARKFSQRFTQPEPLKDIPLILGMKGIGVHEIRVEIQPDLEGKSNQDSFAENDVYYKAVEVVEKPKILLVSANASSPMLRVLGELYNVDVSGRVDNDYSKYAGVIFDNINDRDFPRDRVSKIRKYILEAGNGVAFVGGKNSFEYGGYNNSYVENILPVRSTDKPIDKRNPIAIFFLIDLSGSTTYKAASGSQDTKINIEKAILIKILRELHSNDTVGIASFDVLPHINPDIYVWPTGEIGGHEMDIEDKVLRLKPSGTYGTAFPEPLRYAYSQVKDYPGDKSIILISDGVGSTNMAANEKISINLAADMRKNNVKIYTVGVGFDTSHNFMDALAKTSGGIYFRTDADQRLKLLFGDEENPKGEARTPVTVLDEYHFITRNLFELSNVGSYVSGYNKVYEKNIAQLLITTTGGEPILTVWRFGLGRVATLTADNGLEWGEELVKVDSGKLISGMTNWVVGDLEKGKKIRVNSKDVHLGQDVELTVTADSTPKMDVKNIKDTADEPKILLTRTGVRSYSASFTPKVSGFYGIRASIPLEEDIDAAAVNFPLEYLTLGVDEEGLSKMTSTTDGGVYGEDQLEELIADITGKAKQSSTREVRDSKELWLYFASAALLLYFADAAARRLDAILKRE